MRAYGLVGGLGVRGVGDGFSGFKGFEDWADSFRVCGARFKFQVSLVSVGVLRLSVWIFVAWCSSMLGCRWGAATC